MLRYIPTLKSEERRCGKHGLPSHTPTAHVNSNCVIELNVLSSITTSCSIFMDYSGLKLYFDAYTVKIKIKVRVNWMAKSGGDEECTTC